MISSVYTQPSVHLHKAGPADPGRLIILASMQRDWPLRTNPSQVDGFNCLLSGRATKGEKQQRPKAKERKKN